MPEYLVVICWACAGARPNNNAAVAAAAIMRMTFLPDVCRSSYRDGRCRLTCLSMNQRTRRSAARLRERFGGQARYSPAGRGSSASVGGLLLHAADKLRRIDEAQRDQQPHQRQRHV